MQCFNPIVCRILTIFLLFLSEIHAFSSSGSGKAPQTCGIDNRAFYCQYRQPTCQPRAQRCTESNICRNPNTNVEKGCDRDAVTGGYAVYLGRSPLSDSSSSKRDILEHRFITYRGFTYEFGESYKIQILDINDPLYKYKYGNNVKGTPEYQGLSHCTWEDASTFCRLFNTNYNLVTNNCQHFATKLRETLLYGPCASSQRKRSEQISLEEFVSQLLQNCSCNCDTDTTDGSSSYSQVHGSVLSKFILALLTTLVVSILMLQ